MTKTTTTVIIDQNFIENHGSGEIGEAMYIARERVRSGEGVVIDPYTFRCIIDDHRIKTGKTRIEVDLIESDDEPGFIVSLIEPRGRTTIGEFADRDALIDGLSDYHDDGFRIELSRYASARFIIESCCDDLA